LYRRALARTILKEYKEAEKDLRQASAAVPDDQQIAAELARVQEVRKEHLAQEKKKYKKMFSS
jgi:hypothetical protein